MRTVWKFVLPIVALVLGVGAMLALKMMAPETKAKPVVERVAVIEVIAAKHETRRIDVISQGTVQPRTTSAIGAQIAGVITWVAPGLAAGARVEAQAELLRIDDADYLAARANAAADLAMRQRELAEEEAEALRAADEWAAIGEGDPSELVLRKPQLAAIRARIEAAQAQLAKAERDLERTVVRAPFTGRIETKHVDLGQRVNLGSELLRLQADDVMEVVLPITLEQLRFLDLPLRGEILDAGPAVKLDATIATTTVHWDGNIVRTRAGLDAATRMVHAVAQVPQRSDAPPLMTGLYLRATIAGREVPDVIEIPNSALRSGDRVFVYLPNSDGNDGTLDERSLEVLRRSGNTALVHGAIADGEQIVSVQVPNARNGMPVRIAGATNTETEP
ncbi:MAG: efflux RND transporter periplasmic adaptor subunit [Planctomycetota bacterium]|jgi:RND family efflux transporter MFP subunit|nr:efflux RND transporter periplasmic adaptor subunit [Planctomycetota bacterium]